MAQPGAHALGRHWRGRAGRLDRRLDRRSAASRHHRRAVGAKNLLAHGLVPAADEIAFVSLLAEGVQSIILWVHASMALTALAGMLLGALGGALGGLLGARRA